MSQKLWFLVEWVDESNVFSTYGVVNVDSVISDDNDFHTGKTIFVRGKRGVDARRAQVLRISDNKQYVKELKAMLERQDNQVKNVLSLCMSTIKEMKSGPLYLGGSQAVANPGSSTSYNQDVSDEDTSDSDEEVKPSPNFSIASSKRTPIQKRDISNHQNRAMSVQSTFHGRRSIASSTPLPSRCIEIQKLTFDQGTQTDASLLHPPIAKVEQLESALKQLYKQFLALVSEVQLNDTPLSVSLDISDAEISELEHNGEASVKEELRPEPVRNTSSIELDLDKHPIPQNIPRVRRASAQTTNTSLTNITKNNEMIGIGNGNAVVPARLLKEIDWSSYTTATRQLLQAVFPRRVLATHSLTGKQSPAFTNTRPPKKQLDPNLVDDIVNTVAERCGVSKRIVRSSITTKCSDEAKLYRNRQQIKQEQLAANQENIPPSPLSSNGSSNQRE